jgi:Hypothetical protein FLILHELTA
MWFTQIANHLLHNMQRAVVNNIRRRISAGQIVSRWTTRRVATTPPAGSSPRQSPPPRTGFERVLSRTPKFLRPTVSALHNAPVTHITAFLILHEITAVVPLFGLAGAFHYWNWLPSYFAEGAWVVAGVEKFGRYFKRKGWIRDEEEAEAERQMKGGVNAAEIERKGHNAVQTQKDGRAKWWDKGGGGVRLAIEFGTAYAIVKALLPVRIVISVWGAPWFARWTVIPVAAAIKRAFGRGVAR